MPEKCNNHCTKVVTAECDIQHLQDDVTEIKGVQARIFDKMEENFKWLLASAIGVFVEFIAIAVYMFLTLIQGGD